MNTLLASISAAAGKPVESLASVDASFIKLNLPKIAQELIAEGQAAEFSRIQSIDACSMAGHESIIQAHKADKSKTGADAALAIIQAENSLKKGALAEIDKSETSLSGLRSEPANASAQKAPEAPVSNEASWKASWDKDAELRADFSNNEAAYNAYMKANDGGKIRTLKNRNEK